MKEPHDENMVNQRKEKEQRVWIFHKLGRQYLNNQVNLWPPINQTCTWLKKNRLYFYSSFRFTAKLIGKYKEFWHTLCISPPQTLPYYIYIFIMIWKQIGLNRHSYSSQWMWWHSPDLPFRTEALFPELLQVLVADSSQLGSYLKIVLSQRELACTNYNPFLGTACMQCLMQNTKAWPFCFHLGHLWKTSLASHLIDLLSSLLQKSCSQEESRLNICVQISGSGSASTCLIYGKFPNHT